MQAIFICISVKLNAQHIEEKKATKQTKTDITTMKESYSLLNARPLIFRIWVWISKLKRLQKRKKKDITQDPLN